MTFYLDPDIDDPEWFRDAPLQTAEQLAAHAFNEAVPVGTRVRYWPGTREGEGRESITRTPAWSIPGAALVSVEGFPGGISLTHVDHTTAGMARPSRGSEQRLEEGSQ